MMKARASSIFIIASLLIASTHAGCVTSKLVCYKDQPNRTLGDLTYSGALTHEYCAQVCHDAGKALAGVEAGGQCFCGDAVAPGAVKGTGCTEYCDANYSQYCGGYWQVAVYSFKCSGAPEPIPKYQPLLINPCLDKGSKFASMPFCDPTIPMDERVSDAVSRMTLDEKISALGTSTGAIPSLGLPPYDWWSEASSGVAGFPHGARNTSTTKFAFPITTAMSFNRSVWRATGQQIALETRAIMNAGNGYSTFWAPVINLAREPRWGRNIETPGEDPYLTGEYAEFFVKGFQNLAADPGHLLASACCKHYVANSMERTLQPDKEGWTRHTFDATISDQDLVDSYMKPFQSCVEKGKVSSLMCSYNAVNGKPSCANDWLLKDVARGAWGFDGYITSDCGADWDVFFSHHDTKTPAESVAAILHAGTDVDCGGFVGQYAKGALANQTITISDIDERLQYLFRVRMRLGHFDPPGPLQSVPSSTICSPDAVELSFDGARQSAALLKNEKRTLPLPDPASVGTIAVIGPNALLSKEDSAYYGPGNVCHGKFWTLVDAINASGVTGVLTTAGVPSVTSSDVSGIPAAEAMAASVDEVVLAIGTDLSWAHEDMDAVNITLTQAQTTLVEFVAAAAKKPVTVVIFTATPLDIFWLLRNPKIGAILHVGQPSVTIMGVRELLYGSVSPAGRTIQTWYGRAYQDQISIFDFNMRPGPSAFARPDCDKAEAECPRGTNPGRTYRFYTGAAVVPFGYGLSYSSFAYKVVSAPSRVSLQRLKELLETPQPHTAPSSSSSSPALPLASDNHAMATPVYVESNDESVMGMDDLMDGEEQAAMLSRSLPASSYFVPSSEAAGSAAWRASAAFVVNVTNTGSMDADDVVLGFLTPPGAGKAGVPLKSLFGFERVFVPAGKTVSVWLYPALTDFAAVGVDGRLAPLDGAYKASFGVEETARHGMGFVEVGPVVASQAGGG